MIARLFAPMLFFTTAILISVPSFAASWDSHGHHPPVHVGTTEGGLWTGVSSASPGEAASPAPPEPGVDLETVLLSHVEVDSGLFNGFCSGVNWTLACDPVTEADVPSPTPGLVGQAFQRLPLPASELVVQPPGGRTLVNFETNFYTENGEFTRTVNLLGQQVELRIWPSSYGWHFGDGVAKQTVEAGSPYPDLEITHRYLSKGRVSPRVDTTYAAQFRVNGGPWRDVTGTVTIPGAAQGLRVVTARPVLVGGR